MNDGEFDSEAVARFWASADVGSDDECWEWQRGRGSHGYGAFYAPVASGRARPITAHRFAATISHGAPLPGQHALHSCDNKGCVNPAHLRWGTHRDNMTDAAERGRMRAPNAARTHCARGHEYTPDNTMWKSRHEGGATYRVRGCRECNRQYLAARRERRRAA